MTASPAFGFAPSTRLTVSVLLESWATEATVTAVPAIFAANAEVVGIDVEAIVSLNCRAMPVPVPSMAYVPALAQRRRGVVHEGDSH